MASSEGNSWVAKPKLEKLPLIFGRFFDNSCVIAANTSKFREKYIIL